LLSHTDIIRLRRWVMGLGGKIIFIFKETPYRLTIGKFIHAEDEDGKTVDWSKAFGTQLPHQVLSTYQIEQITVKLREGERVFKNLTELLRRVGK